MWYEIESRPYFFIVEFCFLKIIYELSNFSSLDMEPLPLLSSSQIKGCVSEFYFVILSAISYDSINCVYYLVFVVHLYTSEEIFYLFWDSVFKTHCVFSTYKPSQFQMAAFQVLNSCMWLEATVLESSELNHMKNFQRWWLVSLELLTHIEGTKRRSFGESLWKEFLQRKPCCEFYPPSPEGWDRHLKPKPDAKDHKEREMRGKGALGRDEAVLRAPRGGEDCGIPTSCLNLEKELIGSLGDPSPLVWEIQSPGVWFTPEKSKRRETDCSCLWEPSRSCCIWKLCTPIYWDKNYKEVSWEWTREKASERSCPGGSLATGPQQREDTGVTQSLELKKGKWWP